MLRNLVTAPDSKRAYLIDRSKMLGSGSFAKVFVAQCKTAPGELFAAKEIDKQNYEFHSRKLKEAENFKDIRQEYDLLQKV